jgi:TRAP-type C4-dicarboxylate transport system permease small subunit
VIERALRAVATAFAMATGAAVLLLALLVAVDIVGRRLFGFSLQGTDEYGGYALAMTGSLGFAYALFQRGHTRIDILIPRMPDRVQAAANAASLVTLGGYAAFIAWYALSAFLETIELDARAQSPLATPLWIPQGLWFSGTAFFVLAAAYAAIHAIGLMFRDPGRVNRLYGPLAAVQEVAELAPESGGDGPGSVKPSAEREGRT